MITNTRGRLLAAVATGLAGPLLALMLGACQGSGPDDGAPETVQIFAAASLTEAFESMAPDFEDQHPRYRLAFRFAGSDGLADQILAGEPADVFASADAIQMARVVDAGMAESPIDFASNRLALVHRPDLKPPIIAPGDLARPGLRLVLAGPEVPAGRYAREALRELGAWPAAEANLVAPAPSVKQVLDSLLEGQADAGIVYVTDMTPAMAGELSGMAMPPAVTVEARYSAAGLTGAPRARGAEAFVQFLLGPEAATALAARGFEGP